MAAYAENTEVPPERSRGEIERILTRYGADQFMYGWDTERALIRFRAEGRSVLFVLPLPTATEVERDKAGRRRTPSAAAAAREKEERRRWRALALAVKAKLEVVASGIASFEDEFLAHIVLPDGTTVGNWIRPQVQEAYSSGAMPSPLLAIGAGEKVLVHEEVRD